MASPAYRYLLTHGGVGPVANPLLPSIVNDQDAQSKVDWMKNYLSPTTPAQGASAPAGVNDPYALRVGQIESDWKAGAKSGNNTGVFQFGPDERKQYGITDSSDLGQNLSALQQEKSAHTSIFQSKFNRDPTPGELYLMHQQGASGGPALLAGGDTPAWQSLLPFYGTEAKAQRAISGQPAPRIAA